MHKYASRATRAHAGGLVARELIAVLVERVEHLAQARPVGKMNSCSCSVETSV